MRSGEGRAGGPPGVLIALIAAILILRLILGASLPLTEDEAYYRLWARAPALGYYDHPPMIAWWIWAGTHLAGDTPLGARLLPALSSGLISLLVFRMAEQVGASPETAGRAALWHNAMLLVAAGGFLAVPDAPAALFWAVCLTALLEALKSGSIAWWLGAGTAAGLASLSKYSALFLGPGVLLWLVWTPGGRASLKTPGPWLALAAATSLFGVNLAWNATHQWLTFAKQFGRIAPHRFEPRHLATFLIVQALLINPLITAFLVRGWAASRGSPTPVTRAVPFVATSLPFLAYLALHSLHDPIQAHWPAPVYAPLAICAALASEGASGAWLGLRRAVAPFALAVCALFGVYAALPLAGVPLARDPALPLRGWSVFSQQVEAARRGSGAAWIATTSYGLAAQLSAEPVIKAPILQLSERARWTDLDLPPPDTRAPGLLVDLSRRIDPAALGRCFTGVQPLGPLKRGGEGGQTKTYRLYRLTGARRDLIRQGCW